MEPNRGVREEGGTREKEQGGKEQRRKKEGKVRRK